MSEVELVFARSGCITEKSFARLAVLVVEEILRVQDPLEELDVDGKIVVGLWCGDLGCVEERKDLFGDDSEG